MFHIIFVKIQALIIVEQSSSYARQPRIAAPWMLQARLSPVFQHAVAEEEWNTEENEQNGRMKLTMPTFCVAEKDHQEVVLSLPMLRISSMTKSLFKVQMKMAFRELERNS